MAANYGVRAVAHHQALALAPRLFGPTLPPPCDPPQASATLIDTWPRAAAPSSAPPGRRCLVEIAAMPSFMSPFHVAHHRADVERVRDPRHQLLDQRYREPGDNSDVPWRTTVRYPSIWTPTVAQAATTSLGQVFLGFSRFPAARSASDAHGVTTVRWTDMRFAGGPFGLDDRRQGPGPFTATVRVDADGRVIAQSLGLR